MRAHEFLREEDHEQDMKNQLLTLLTTLHASQVPSISIEQIQQSLGSFATNQWISDQVKNIPIVKSSNDDEISLDVETDTSDKDTAVDSEDKQKDKSTVKKMAKKALKKRKKD